MIISAVVHSGGMRDSDGARKVIPEDPLHMPMLKRFRADGAYSKTFEQWVKKFAG